MHILEYVRTTLLNDAAVHDIVARANELLEIEARRPRGDLTAAKQSRNRLVEDGKKLIASIRRSSDEKSQMMLEAELKTVNQQSAEQDRLIRALSRRENMDVVRIQAEDVRMALLDLRKLLLEDVPLAADALREFLGPIKIHEEPSPIRKGTFRWIATFSPKWTTVLAKPLDGETAVDVATAVAPVTDTPVQVTIDRQLTYQLVAPEVAALHAEGLTKAAIARRIGKSVTVVKEALRFLDEGTVRPPLQRKPAQTKVTSGPRLQDIAPEVARRRDVDEQPFSRIARELGISSAKAARAYEHAHPELKGELQKGNPIRRGPRRPHLSKEIFDLIHQLLKTTMTNTEIANEAGCSQQTVGRERERIRTNQDVA
jgi:transposase